MLNKEEIEEIKIDSLKFKEYLSSNSDKNIIYLLNKFGKIPNEFTCIDELIKLFQKRNDKLSLLVIKNLAKISNVKLFDIYKNIIINETNSELRREATSAIGRMRSKQNIDYLIELLNDYDPEVILQAIRGLMSFKKEEKIHSILVELINHPNEIVSHYIDSELNKNNIKNIKHSSVNELMTNSLVSGDVLTILKSIKREEIHLTFTSPPYYNARDYSIYKSYNEYIEFLRKVFIEIHRVTKEGRFFLINTSPIIIPRVSRNQSSKRYPIPFDLHCMMDEIGWEFIDDIIWVKPEASVKNRNAGFLQHRKPLAYKPNSRTEMIMVYRKKTTKLIDWNLKQYNEDVINESLIEDGYETSNVWHIDPKSDKTHSAVFPIELCNKVVKYYSLKGDLVFDPFAGSGTFAKSAYNLDRNFFITEINPPYVDRIKENLDFDNNLLTTHKEKMKYYTSKEFKYLMENTDDIATGGCEKNNN
uniref:DNA methyltransferase n=1 Tax=Aliarcobacter sp. TaxID=2321116 RepID=UPI0040481FEF